MLYKQAWQELKGWVKHQIVISCEIDVATWKVALIKMNELEKRWRIVPQEKGKK